MFAGDRGRVHRMVELCSLTSIKFLGTDVATKAKRKLQNSHYDGKKKEWDWDKYVALHKEQLTIMESLTDYGYSGIDKGTNVHHFLKGIKSIELEVAVNAILAQPEKYGKNFYTTLSYLGQMVRTKCYTMQSVHIAMTRSQPAKPKVAALRGKIVCKKYPKAV